MMHLKLEKHLELMVGNWFLNLETTNINKLKEEVIKDVAVTLRPEAARIETVFSNMQNKILSHEELGKLASTHSFKLLAELEDKRMKFDRNYIYNKFADPNPDKGSFKDWRAQSILTETNEVQGESIYKVVIYHPAKHTKMLAYNILGSQTLQDLESSIY